MSWPAARAEMETAIAALAVELPGEVWDDVNARWAAARDAGDQLATALGVEPAPPTVEQLEAENPGTTIAEPLP